ncbi:MAG: aspartate ammonia-lyase [Tepidanaerobacter acetatoxydans]|uniref:aspartate ammonia-lyase n=1 Tax=Tepidanaerobacter acetatoxydans TaxID=499229 RepID=UPI0026EA918A|nr:aspartate ammonia-lyase [Tepidanaerobacter acetatoxydans]NLU09681.1 aspartate ammonia-lyase [Tepidanaerobacter acetatoxydans]
MEKYRLEHDLLGTKEVPIDAYYGIQTLRALENFPITGYRPHKELILAMAMVKKAAALANMQLGKLDKKRANAIIQAANEILEGQYLDQFIVDVIQGGAGTSLNMNVNEVIANRAIEMLGGEKGDYTLISPNSHVNMSQSTNDVFPTAVRIALLKLVKSLLAELEQLHEALLKKSEEFDDVIKMGRTHLQDAVPIRLGQEFGAYARVINRDLRRIKTASEALKEVNIGATAVGTGLNAQIEYIESMIENLRKISGFQVYSAEDLVDATQNVDTLAAFSGSLKILGLNLSKIANDLRLMASGPRAGLKEINLPPVQPGSSIMPGKVNPVMAEVVNQVAFQVIGNDHTVALVAQAGQFELNVMEPVMVFNIIQSIEILTNVIKVFREKCIMGITANRERCQDMVNRSVGIITALVPYIGYEGATKLAKEVLSSDKTVPEIISEKGIFTPEEMKIILSPQNMTQPSSSGKTVKSFTL